MDSDKEECRIHFDNVDSDFKPIHQHSDKKLGDYVPVSLRNVDANDDNCDDDVFDLVSSDESRSKNNEYKIIADQRGTWGNKLEFFLVITGYTVGVGSVWRFPIICSRNGGGAFLIPFFFFLVMAGGPLYYMEMCLGQFTGKSAGHAFECCPLLRGLGALQVTISLTVLWYGMMVMAWTFYFLYASFYPVLPWTTCGNSWNTPSCTAISELWSRTSENMNTSLSSFNMTSAKPDTNFSSSAYEFWEFNAVGRSGGLEEMGHVQLHMVICHFLAWTFTVLAVIKGVQTLGKVVYVTATAPYLFLTIIFIRGLLLDGALEGIKTFITPDFKRLAELQVWLDAALQVFYSLGPSWGGVITMASYNKFHRKNFWSSALCVASAGFTSFYNGLVVFTLLGFLSHKSGMTVEAVAKQTGPGLAFVVFPTILSNMPIPNVWCVLFFLTLVTIVFDSLFGMFETITSYVIDTFPGLVHRRVLVNIITGALFFLSGLPLCMNGGVYLFQLGDWYFAAYGLLACSFLECVAICWFYGTDRFANDINIMTGRRVSVPLRFLWTAFIPAVVLIAFILTLAKTSSPRYGDGYIYSDGWIAVGAIVGLLPLIVMLGLAVQTVVIQKGSFIQKLRGSLVPSERWCPNNATACETYMEEPYTYPDIWWKRCLIDIVGADTEH